MQDWRNFPGSFCSRSTNLRQRDHPAPTRCSGTARLVPARRDRAVRALRRERAGAGRGREWAAGQTHEPDRPGRGG